MFSLSEHFKSHQGLIIARQHSIDEKEKAADLAAERYLLENLDALKAQGVEYIFLEQLPKAVDTIRRMPPHAEFPQRVNLLLIIMQQAASLGIEVVGIDTDKFKGEPDLFRRIQQRDTHMAAEAHRIAEGKKYVFPAGVYHAEGLKRGLEAPVICLFSQEEKTLKGATVEDTLRNYFEREFSELPRDAGTLAWQQKMLPAIDACVFHDVTAAPPSSQAMAFCTAITAAASVAVAAALYAYCN